MFGRLGARGGEALHGFVSRGLATADGHDDRVGGNRTDPVDEPFEQTVAGFADAQERGDGPADVFVCVHGHDSCVLRASAILIVSGSGPGFPARSASVVATRSTPS